MFFETKQDARAKTYDDHKKAPELLRSIRIYLNYFEALGYLYVNDIVDRSMIIDMLGGVSLRMYSKAKWYIEMTQDELKKKEPRTNLIGLPYAEWGKMNKMILENNDDKIVLPIRPAP